jgi:hypothetical protein
MRDFRAAGKALALAAAAALAGCAHPIVITPDTARIERSAVKPIDVNVGYFISEADLAKQVTTPGGGGDNVSYYPYRDLEPALFRVLSNLFRRAYTLKAPNDPAEIRANDIAFVFLTEIQTSSSSDGVMTWPPTDFTVIVGCKAYDRDGKLVLERRVLGQGKATFDEFKSDFPLASKRASFDAMTRLQRELNNAPELRR